MKHTKSYRKDYPRPRFFRNDYELLNGTWDFKFDRNDIGIKEKWHLGFNKDSDILVPFSYQTKQSGIFDTTSCFVVWYQKKINIKKGKQVILHLDGSDYLTQVYVNGIFIGSEAGGYHRLSFDITHALSNQIKQHLVFRIEDTFDTTQPRGKQRWKNENFGCWYVETTGLWKTVWLEYVNQTYIKEIDIISHNEDLLVTFDITLNQIKPNLNLEIEVTFDDELISKTQSHILRNNQKISIDVKTNSDQFKIKEWSLTDTNLYDVKYRLFENDQEIDQVLSYFGFRFYQTVQQGIYLNRNPIYLKMLLDQGYFLDSGLTPISEEDIVKDILLTKEMGFNGIRKHQKIEDERFYYYCDILGLYVWLEMPSFYEFSNGMSNKIIEEWIKIVKQYRNYSSIMAYVLFNESWGIPAVKYDIQQQNLTLSLYYLTKALDKNRFVISNDGWEHTKSDIITIHNYVEEGKDLHEIYYDINKHLLNQYENTHQVKQVFANGYTYEGQPVIFSEYGGIAFTKDLGWGYGKKVDDEETFIHRLEGLTDSIKKIRIISGYCLTQTTDVEQEVNGLLKPNREPKIEIGIIKKINEKEV